MCEEPEFQVIRKPLEGEETIRKALNSLAQAVAPDNEPFWKIVDNIAEYFFDTLHTHQWEIECSKAIIDVLGLRVRKLEELLNVEWDASTGTYQTLLPKAEEEPLKDG